MRTLARIVLVIAVLLFLVLCALIVDDLVKPDAPIAHVNPNRFGGWTVGGEHDLDDPVEVDETGQTASRAK